MSDWSDAENVRFRAHPPKEVRSNVILTDEEIEAQRKASVASRVVTQTERDAINADASDAAQEREINRQDQQANYDKHKGAR